MCGISKVSFEIPHKISNPYIERYDFYAMLKIYELSDWGVLMCFWNAAPNWIMTVKWKAGNDLGMTRFWEDDTDTYVKK